MGRKTAAAVVALMLGLGITPVLAQDGGAQAQAERLQVLSKRPGELFKQGKHAEALAAAEDYLKAVEPTEKTPGASTAAALNSVCWYALFARRFERAFEAGDRAMALSPSDAAIQGNRAYALMFLGRSDESLAVFVGRKGETIGGQKKWEDVIVEDFAEFQKAGLDHPLMARAREAMAVAPESPRVLLQQGQALRSAGKMAEALPLLQKYAETVKVRRGGEHPDYAEALRALGILHYASDRFAEAETPMRQALAIDEKAYGSEHPLVATDLDNLALILQDANQLAQAEPFYKRALEARERIFGKEHPDTLTSVNNLAALYRNQSHYGEAEPLYKRVLEVRERILGKEHPSTLISAANLATYIRTRGATARPSCCASAPWRPKSTFWVKSILIHWQASTIWRACIAPRAVTARPSRYTSAPWRLKSAFLARSIPAL
jgi:tetratricopeptide (TPR) repeat protein